MRIVSLAPAITEILFALGAGNDVVAITRFCDWPDEATEKPRLSLGQDINLDELGQYNPDFILSSIFFPPSLEAWQGRGKHRHFDPMNLWEVFDTIKIVGESIGKKDEAQKLVEQMNEAFDNIRQSHSSQRPTVYMEEWYDPPTAAGRWVPELMAIAGGSAVISEINQPSTTFPLVRIKVADPDFIICHWSGWGKRQDIKQIAERPGWEELSAIQQNHVRFIDDALVNRPGPRLCLGASLLNNIIQEKMPAENLR